jgi:tetratricopeptide (TPR) repeat protein
MSSKFLLLLLFAFPSYLFSSENNIDSLKKHLRDFPSEDTTAVHTLNGISLAYMHKANDSCLLYADKAIALATKIGYTAGVADGYDRKACFYNGKGEYKKGLYYSIEGYKLFEKLKDKRAMSNLMNSIGNTYLGLNNTEKALESYLKSYEIAAQDSSKYMMAISSIGIGNIYLDSRKDAATAIDYFKRSKAIFEKQNALYPLSICYTLIGNCLVELERYDEAFENFDKAVVQLKELDNSYGIASTYEIIAAAYEKQGSKTIALNFYEKAYSIFVERKAYDNIKNVCLNISNLYSKTLNFEKALEYYVHYSNYKDSVFNLESNKQVLEIEGKYESEKQLQQIELQEAKLSQQQTRQTILMIGIGVAVLLMLLFFFRYYEKQKSNKALSIANENLESKNDIIQLKNKEITDSIEYAKRIQNTLLPSEKYIWQTLKRLNNK